MFVNFQFYNVSHGTNRNTEEKGSEQPNQFTQKLKHALISYQTFKFKKTRV